MKRAIRIAVGVVALAIIYVVVRFPSDEFWHELWIEFSIHFPAVLLAESLATVIVGYAGFRIARRLSDRKGHEGHDHTMPSDLSAVADALQETNRLLRQIAEQRQPAGSSIDPDYWQKG